MIDPVCLFHGKKWSEHEGGRCLYCCICFDTNPPSGWWVDEGGTTWDICNDCQKLEEEAKLRSSVNES